MQAIEQNMRIEALRMHVGRSIDDPLERPQSPHPSLEGRLTYKQVDRKIPAISTLRESNANPRSSPESIVAT